MLMDISAANLDMVYRIVERDIKSNGLTGITLGQTTDQKEAVKDAKYIVNCARIGGLDAFQRGYGRPGCLGIIPIKVEQDPIGVLRPSGDHSRHVV